MVILMMISDYSEATIFSLRVYTYFYTYKLHKFPI